MSTQQLAALKAYIASVPAWAALPVNSDTSFTIAIELNKPAVPDFWVWRTSVSVAEIMSNGFDWTRVDNATEPKWRIWKAMADLGSLSPHKLNQRAGINAAWTTGANDAQRLAIFGHCQERATVVEKVLATTGVGATGVTTSNDGVGPATKTHSGPVSYQDVDAARAS